MTDEIASTACGTARPLLAHLPEVAGLASVAKSIFVFLDFDGTLAPIVDNAAESSIPPVTRAALVRLAHKGGFSLAIISGRSLPDLKERVALDGLTYGGNHGLVIAGPGLHFVEPCAVTLARTLKSISRELEMRLSHIPRARVENKWLTASVHYRSVDDTLLPHLHQIVNETVAAAGGHFATTQGMSVIDVRPQVNWNKGAAALWIMKSAGLPNALPICLGDDASDEDAFAALDAGITVRVGGTGQTLAKYRLHRQRDVAVFLGWLANLGSHET